MLKMIIIAGAAVVVLATTVQRMRDNRTTPLLMWLLMVGGAALMVATGSRVLYPGTPADSAPIAGAHGRAVLQVPEGHALLVTANLAEIDPEEIEQVDEVLTSYTLELDGPDWEQRAKATVRRKVEQGEERIKVNLDHGIRGSQRPTLISLHENLQDRFRLGGSGEVKVKVSHWNGLAAESLQLDVVPAPLPATWFWVIAGAMSVLAILCDVKYGTDRLSADVGFLAFGSAFIAGEVVPADGLRDVLFTLALGLVVGGLLVGSLGQGAERLLGRNPRRRAVPRKRAPAPSPAAVPPGSGGGPSGEPESR